MKSEVAVSLLCTRLYTLTKEFKWGQRQAVF